MRRLSRMMKTDANCHSMARQALDLRASQQDVDRARAAVLRPGRAERQYVAQLAQPSIELALDYGPGVRRAVALSVDDPHAATIEHATLRDEGHDRGTCLVAIESVQVEFA